MSHLSPPKRDAAPRVASFQQPFLPFSPPAGKAGPADAGEPGVEDVDPLDLEFMITRGEVQEAIDEAQRMLEGLRPSHQPLTLYCMAQVLTRLCEAHGAPGQFGRAEAACLKAVARLDEIAAPGGLETMAKAEAQAILAYTHERMQRYRSALTDDTPRTADHRSNSCPR